MRYKMYNILKPIKLGNVTLKNRIAYLGMAKGLSDPGNFVSEREIAYYTNYAKGGAGMVTTGACLVFPDYPSQLPSQLGLYDDKFIPGIEKLAKSVQSYGAKLILQPWHPGLANYGAAVEGIKGPTDFTVEEIHEMQEAFAQAALRAKKAGCDGIEWHMAHNYLPEQFSVELFNKRTDEYGADTIENAARFSVEAVKRTRELVGEDFLINLKINAWDMGQEGGMTPDRCALLAVEMEKAGVNVVAVSAGGTNTNILGMSADGHRAEGWKIDWAAETKKAVSIPVMATGSIRHVSVMEEAISSGKCDMIGMGRGLLADPEFVNKVAEGREDELHPCISCMSCFSTDHPLKQHCSMNPTATWEYLEKDLLVDGDGRKVMIVGAGPAGVNAAVILAKRGFKPVIFDKSSHIGGSVRYAASPDGKAKLFWAIEYYKKVLAVYGVETRLNVEVTKEMVEEFDPYAVFVATGTNPIRPKSIPGIMGENVVMAKEVLENMTAYTGEDMVIIGGGMVGLEIADTYKKKGNNATIVEMQPLMDIMMAARTNGFAFQHAAAAGCVPMYEHKLLEICEDKVVLENAEGAKVEVPASVVVLCMGFTPETALYDAISDRANVVKIGDCDGVDNIAKAARNAHVAATSLV